MRNALAPRAAGASGQYHRGAGARPLGFRSVEKVNGQVCNRLGSRHLPTTTLPAPRRGLSLYTPYPLPIHTVDVLCLASGFFIGVIHKLVAGWWECFGEPATPKRRAVAGI